jgi:drug/metabolite transporter (DMT)-like permease
MDRFFDRRGIDNRRPRNASQRKYLIMAGCISGVLLCAASAAQQIGIAYTTASKAGFITALYVVIVPLLSIFLKQRPTGQIWFCVLLALVGMYLLCMTGSFSVALGDLLVMVCAFGYSIHILVIDRFSPLVDGVRMSCIQFFTAGVLGIIPMLLEQPSLSGIFAGAMPILYAGVLSSGVAYTLQVVAQKDTDPTVATLIMSLESVISMLAGWVILGQALSPRELGGCALVFAAIIVAQLPERKKA